MRMKIKKPKTLEIKGIYKFELIKAEARLEGDIYVGKRPMVSIQGESIELGSLERVKKWVDNALAWTKQYEEGERRLESGECYHTAAIRPTRKTV